MFFNTSLIITLLAYIETHISQGRPGGVAVPNIHLVNQQLQLSISHV